MVRADLENTVECAAGSAKATFVEQGKAFLLSLGSTSTLLGCSNFELFTPNIWTGMSVNINVNIVKRPLTGRKVENVNSNLKDMDVDILYHLGIDTSDMAAIKAKFGDIKVVAMGGSRGRVITFAKYAYEQLKSYYQMKDEDATTDLAKKAGRFVMYKV